ncbi:VanZ family protein [Solibacillus sp. MA9]|uniref:VanZ family protein n=1 Tax=Solibacillus palustris TaxID=2908203 RepID=A0ABS9UB05_9BACL|nr:VanZ family protein [Solibacillus sp. MA9]MCH7321143.1 VanZ family protein [Solibacillus sp. MA9]
MRKSIFFVVTGLIVVAIMSNMSYEQQSLLPFLQDVLQDKPLEHWLSQLQFHYWGSIVSVETKGYFKFVEFLIRKGTHFFGYGLLALILFSFYNRLKWRFPMILSFISVVVIASLDEYRQSMIPGRIGVVDDVMLDASGALTFLLIAKLILVMYHYVKR